MSALPPEERIVRAVCTDKYDKAKGRISPSLMMGPDTSVSRLLLIPLADHWELFRSHVQKPPERMLELLGVIGVRALQALGAAHEPKRDVVVEVAPDTRWNPPEAHAEIKGSLTRGLANKVVQAMQYSQEDGAVLSYTGKAMIPNPPATGAPLIPPPPTLPPSGTWCRS